LSTVGATRESGLASRLTESGNRRAA
jgi:hypothetical protein